MEEKTASSRSSQEQKYTQTDRVNALASQLQNISLSQQNKILFEATSIDSIIKYIKMCRNIITMVGAGISTSAGIPDFRSPGTGIYHNLNRYQFPYPQAIFDFDYFINNPEPFYQLARDLLPVDYRPTKSHYFIKLLEEKGILLRHYSQNIDSLDRMAGITHERLIEVHGTFYKSHCLKCKKEYNINWLKRQINRKRIPHCYHCNSLVKPNIIFLGENLPHRFYENIYSDLKKSDLIIVMGTSLEEEPFASLALRPSNMCPRLIINLMPVGSNIGFQFGKSNNREFLWIIECDVGCQLLADELGWGDDLLNLAKPK